ncbi:hypothetical protein [Phenylobacterium sp.]|uniref:hypothetical protein n=1 Tax=Phenylobacterium sp. TaxID=1871053 RepID=UPI002D0EB0BC|nr:hypothetical protein [Phenylobacterium sp.]HVI34421.1 hypothetical protein [Phenylobacterium sp.]
MTYTLLVTGPDGRQQARLTDYSDEEALIAEVRHLLSAEQPRIAVARGRGEAVTPLGTWDWCGGLPTWTPQAAARSG